MKLEDFDVRLFSVAQKIQLVILLLALISVIILAVLATENKEENTYAKRSYSKPEKFFLRLTISLFLLSFIPRSQIRYEIRDYIEKEEYKLVVAKWHFSQLEFTEVDYRDYWKNMNWYSYEFDSETNTIYMIRFKI